MIVKIHNSGHSFKGLAQYLCHDPKAETAHRVAWTHAINCVHDDEWSVVHEMYTTFANADALKTEAGVRAGGRKLEKPVKHLSLNWHPTDEPTQEHMIETAQEFLLHMKWDEHQAFLVAQTDKAHPHVHVMLNAVHPETGKKLDDGLERRRAQAWALEYEREQGKIHCEQRTLPPEEREPSPPRDAWMTLKEAEQPHIEAEQKRRTFDADYMAREENRKVIKDEEWTILKDHQREQREAFFEAGRDAYREVRNDIYREVRDTFRPEWADYYSKVRRGRVDEITLMDIREELRERQHSTLVERRDEAYQELRTERNAEYRQILTTQQEERSELRDRQQAGLSSPYLLDYVNDTQPANGELSNAFRSAASEICERAEEGERDQTYALAHDYAPAEPSGVRGGEDAAMSLGVSAIGGFAIIAERIFDGFFGGGEPIKMPPRQTTPEPEFKKDNPFARVAEAARKQAEDQAIEERNRTYWDDRERKRD